MSSPPFRVGSATDTGLVRASNQDHLLVSTPLFAVADGMGGHAGGEVASAVAVTALEDAWVAGAEHSPDALVGAAKAANRAVWEKAQSEPDLRGMGTTLAAIALTSEDSRLAVVNVGDSRVYLFRDGQLEQLTVDHSVVAELVAEGQLGEAEAEFHPQRHVLTRALGVDPDVAVDLFTVDARAGDRLLLCSDGLSKEVTDGQVAAVLRRLSDPGEAARALVTEARVRGGSDNITVVIVDVPYDEEVEKAAPEATSEVAIIPPPDRRRRRGHGWRFWERPNTRLVTARVLGFFVALLVVVAAAGAAIAWYARANYFVGLSSDQLTIYKGRPGGALWFRPTVVERTGVTTSQVLAGYLPQLRSGVSEGSLGDARRYVSNLEREFAASEHPDSATQ